MKHAAIMKEVNDTIFWDHQPGSLRDDPKNKVEEGKEKVLNRQDDNSYDERDETKTSEKAQVKQEDTKDEFEYNDSGEFQNDSPVADTNPNDDFL